MGRSWSGRAGVTREITDVTKEGANPMRDFEQGVNVQYQTVKRIDVKDLLGSGFNTLKNIRQIGAYKIFETT